jgi:hypothetical protein
MRQERFSLYRRGKIWYVQFYNPQARKYLSGRSTGESNRNSAFLVVAEWLRSGVPDPARGFRPVQELLDLNSTLSIIRNAPLASDDAERVVRILKERQLIESALARSGPDSEPFEKSPYVRERIAHGQRISRRHCYEVRNRLDYYWKPYFGKDKKISEIRKSDIASFSLWLKEEKKLKANTINNILSAGTVALRWAARNEIISKDPSDGLMTFSGKPAKRGVLTDSEVMKLFALPWLDEESKIGNMLAMCTGLRAGEVVALQVRDIGADRLYIRHSWNRWDALKGTKTDTERSVPIIPSMRECLLDLSRRNPHGVGPTTFVFWSSVTPCRRWQERLFFLQGQTRTNR